MKYLTCCLCVALGLTVVSVAQHCPHNGWSIPIAGCFKSLVANQVVPDGVHALDIVVYDRATGETAYVESDTVAVTDGQFVTVIGDGGIMVLDHRIEYEIGISINQTAELVPRVVLVKAPVITLRDEETNMLIMAPNYLPRRSVAAFDTGTRLETTRLNSDGDIKDVQMDKRGKGPSYSITDAGTLDSLKYISSR